MQEQEREPCCIKMKNNNKDITKYYSFLSFSGVTHSFINEDKFANGVVRETTIAVGEAIDRGFKNIIILTSVPSRNVYLYGINGILKNRGQVSIKIMDTNDPKNKTNSRNINMKYPRGFYIVDTFTTKLNSFIPIFIDKKNMCHLIVSNNKKDVNVLIDKIEICDDIKNIVRSYCL